MDVKLIKNGVIPIFAATVLSVGLPQIVVAASSDNVTSKPSSEEQIKTAIRKRHDGDIIDIKRNPQPNHPHCHIVKLKTKTGGLKYIRHNCSSDG